MLRHLKVVFIFLIMQSVAVLAVTDTIVIQQGLNGYLGVSDTYIGQGLPSNSSNMGKSTYMHVGRC